MGNHKNEEAVNDENKNTDNLQMNHNEHTTHKQKISHLMEIIKDHTLSRESFDILLPEYHQNKLSESSHLPFIEWHRLLQILRIIKYHILTPNLHGIPFQTKSHQKPFNLTSFTPPSRKCHTLLSQKKFLSEQQTNRLNQS